jgi:uncharacterized protein YcaQ
MAPGGRRTQLPSKAVTGLDEISQRDARRIVLAAQGFGERRPTGRIDRRHFRRVLDQLGTVQLDSVNVLTRTHELVFFARLGAYDRAALTKWLWSSREVFEYWGHEASLHPVERYPLFRWRMVEDHAWTGVREVATDNPALVDTVLAEVLARGPVSVGELEAEDPGRPDPTMERPGESWWGWGHVKRVMAHLFWTGQITATRRNGFERIYMAPEQWLPAQALNGTTPTETEAHRELLLVGARALGVGTARDLADYYRLRIGAVKPLLDDLAADGHLLPVSVDGWRQPAYLHPEALIPRRAVKARALLSPFDSLIWERQRTERLWGFRYRLEIYTPAPKRVHGYYVLPFLLGEDLVGRVDLKSDRKAGVLRVQAAWIEERPHVTRAAGGDEAVATELAASLVEMASWLDLPNGVAVQPRGDLAPALQSALGS